MTDVRDLALFVWTRLDRLWLGGTAGTTFLALLGLMLAAFVLDRRAGRDGRRFLSRQVLTDALYAVFYVGGVFAFLFAFPLESALRGLFGRYAPFLQLDLLTGLPDGVQTALFVVVTDGIWYWQHRWAHSSRILWSFHCIHHSPRSLTPLTRFRFHFVDILVYNLMKFVPALLLGVPGPHWAVLVPLWVQVIAHCDLDVGYGLLGRVFVSPRFHRIHHSREPGQCHTNFGMTFAFWDALFGTEARGLGRPAAYGPIDLEAPESFIRQMAFPLVALARGLVSPPAGKTPAASTRR